MKRAAYPVIKWGSRLVLFCIAWLVQLGGMYSAALIARVHESDTPLISKPAISKLFDPATYKDGKFLDF